MNGDNKEKTSPPEASHEEAIRLYESWVATLNHYSGLVLTIRITAITSGIIILAAAGTLLLKEENLKACRLVCGFGFAFSIVLWFMVDNCYEHYKVWLNQVTKIEAKINIPEEMRTWKRYKNSREERRGSYVWIVHNGCTALIILAAIIIFFATFF